MAAVITKICTLQFWMRALSFAWIFFSFSVSLFTLIRTYDFANPCPETFQEFVLVAVFTVASLLTVFWLYGVFKRKPSWMLPYVIFNFADLWYAILSYILFDINSLHMLAHRDKESGHHSTYISLPYILPVIGIRLLFTIICYMFYEQIKEESRQRASILSESGAKYDRLVNEEQTIGERQNTVKAEDGKTVCGKLWSFVVLFMAVFIIIIITCSCLLGLLLVYLICEAKEQ